jgi:uncharacterized membrane protein
MLGRALKGLGGTLLAGVVAFLPLMLTALLLGWLGETAHDYIGPGSQVGEWLRRLGLSVVTAEAFAWVVGCALLLAAFWFTGLLVKASLLDWLFGLLESLVLRIPLVGPVYGLAGRFAKLLGPHKAGDLQAMTPVWCLFGGQGGTAVLALMTSTEVVVIEGARYRPVLVPSAPVPVGGGLLFLPEDWVRPAGLGIDELTSLYVSMGVALPRKLTMG